MFHKCNSTAEITFDVNVCRIAQYIDKSPELQLIMLCAVARYYDISSEADRGVETI